MAGHAPRNGNKGGPKDTAYQNGSPVFNHINFFGENSYLLQRKIAKARHENRMRGIAGTIPAGGGPEQQAVVIRQIESLEIHARENRMQGNYQPGQNTNQDGSFHLFTVFTGFS
jgi:hypothetical protein